MADKVNLYTAGLLASHIDVNGQGDKFLSNNGEYKTADIEIDNVFWTFVGICLSVGSFAI